MLRFRFLHTLTAFALLAGSALTALHAQVPTDKQIWKDRCAMLTAQSGAIDGGSVSPALLAATRGVPSLQFTTLAFDRSRANQHQVACTLFLLAAVAERGAKDSDKGVVHNRVVVGGEEAKFARGESATLSERLARTKAEAGQVRAPALTSAQLLAVINAASTLAAP